MLKQNNPLFCYNGFNNLPTNILTSIFFGLNEKQHERKWFLSYYFHFILRLREIIFSRKIIYWLFVFCYLDNILKDIVKLEITPFAVGTNGCTERNRSLFKPKDTLVAMGTDPNYLSVKHQLSSKRPIQIDHYLYILSSAIDEDIEDKRLHLEQSIDLSTVFQHLLTRSFHLLEIHLLLLIGFLSHPIRKEDTESDGPHHSCEKKKQRVRTSFSSPPITTDGSVLFQFWLELHHITRCLKPRFTMFRNSKS